MTCEHAFADLSGIAPDRLRDAQGLAAVLLAAANAAGLHPAGTPQVHDGPKGVAAVLVCHGGHVALHALPDVGVCFADVAGIGAVRPQRAIDVLVKCPPSERLIRAAWPKARATDESAEALFSRLQEVITALERREDADSQAVAQLMHEREPAG